jgi:hypothetical protein
MSIFKMERYQKMEPSAQETGNRSKWFFSGQNPFGAYAVLPVILVVVEESVRNYLGLL